MSLLLLYLLWSLYYVKVDCRTFPYVSFRGVALPNHAYVDLSLVGETTSGLDNDTIICHTNLTTCCTLLFGGHRGEWFYPNGTILPPFFADIYKDAWNQKAYLLRMPNGEASGIYRCDIATVAAPDYSKGESVYVGLYSSGGNYTTHHWVCRK